MPRRHRSDNEEGTTSRPALPTRKHRRRALAALPLLLTARARAAGDAALSLVMLERRDCPACRLWHIEIGPIWPRSDLGRRAPLRRVDLAAGPLPADLAFLAGVTITPTFVLIGSGAERGRIVGYQGETFFWQEAEALLGR